MFISVRGRDGPRTIVWRGGRIMSMKNSDDAIGYRAVPPRPPSQMKSTINYEVSNCVTLSSIHFTFCNF